MIQLCNQNIFFILVLVCVVRGYLMPASCKPGQYFEPGTMACENCPVNVSMVTSKDGFGCSCEEHSIPVNVARCRPCNATDIVSADGTACVPRRCQISSGRIACRKCPNDYIAVTQNFDGSPLKEVLCVKCSRGYKAENNICVKCESCTCSRSQVIVRGICIPKTYVNSRPKYEGNSLHPLALLDVVKHEYLCSQFDVRACRTLANECVRNFYSPDSGGPCRMWTQPNMTSFRGIPQLIVDTKSENKIPGEIKLPLGKGTMVLAAAVYTADGGFKLVKDSSQAISSCHLPLRIRIGQDMSFDCIMTVSTLGDQLNTTLSPYIIADENLVQVPVYLWKTSGDLVKIGKWPSNKFRRYFIIDNSRSTTTNITNTVYLRTALLRLSIVRDRNTAGSLRVNVSMESHYASKPQHIDLITMSLKVVHDMPDAGVLKGLEIWGGVLGSLSLLYAMVQWRGLVRRGGLYISLLPLIAAAVADTLYFAAWFSTLHALAAEAGTLGITLPLSSAEEHIIAAFIYSSVSLKAIKIVWLNYKQCTCDIFFLDWSEYNPPFRDVYTVDKSNNWRAITLAREWSVMQTKRRVCPGYTVTLALVILQLLSPWKSYLPQSHGYKWAVATLAWWSSYSTMLIARWVVDRVMGSPSAALPKVCAGLELSLLVFEEELYAHYVHGRNDEPKELRSMAGPLATCRVACAPQLRAVYKQLANSAPGLGEIETKQALLSRFLAAFFERLPRSKDYIEYQTNERNISFTAIEIHRIGDRSTKPLGLVTLLPSSALDGLSWVASERTLLERLLDVELTTREAGNTSTLLYDPVDTTPSCLSVTWWGQEWSLATFDAMLFGVLLIAAKDTTLAAIITLITWQIMKHLRDWFGKNNQKCKTDIEIQ